MAFVSKDQKERPKRSCQSVYRKFQEIGRDEILAQRRKISNSTSSIEDNVSELNLDAMQFQISKKYLPHLRISYALLS